MQLNRYLTDALSAMTVDVNTFTSFRVVLLEPAQDVSLGIYVQKPNLVNLCCIGASKVFDHLKYVQGPHKLDCLNLATFRSVGPDSNFLRSQHVKDLPYSVRVFESYSLVQPEVDNSETIGMLQHKFIFYIRVCRYVLCSVIGECISRVCTSGAWALRKAPCIVEFSATSGATLKFGEDLKPGQFVFVVSLHCDPNNSAAL